jgi:hypothetical protein
LFEDLVAVGQFGGFFDGFPDHADRIEAITSPCPLQVVPDEPDSGIIPLTCLTCFKLNRLQVLFFRVSRVYQKLGSTAC